MTSSSSSLRGPVSRSALWVALILLRKHLQAHPRLQAHPSPTLLALVLFGWLVLMGSWPPLAIGVSLIL
jgi:hypothetical protein